MKSRKRFALSLVVVAALAGLALALTGARPPDPLVTGKVELKSVGALASIAVGNR